MATKKKAKPNGADESKGKHKWVKVNAVAQKDSKGTFDVYKCSNCEVSFHRYGKAWTPPDKKCTKVVALAKIPKNQPKVTKEEALERTTQIRNIVIHMRAEWWEVGQHIEKAVSDRVPEALGLSFSKWAEDVFGGEWLKMRRAFQAVKALEKIPEEKRNQISEGNAYQISRLPEKVRSSTEWVKKAIDLNNDQFKAATEKFIEKKTGIKDPMLSLSEALGFSTVPKSLFDIIKETVELATRMLDVDKDAKKGKMEAVESIFSHYLTSFAGVRDAEEKQPGESPSDSPF